MEELIAPTCKQANELIAFLYGELSDVESRAFQHHMHGCSSCSEELAAFSNIRSSVVHWRDESLGKIAAPATVPYAAVRDASRERPSALVALREFFNLSPIWLKGAVAFATLLFCLFAGLAVVRLRNNPIAPVAENAPNSDGNAYSEQQLNALVERRVQDELQRIRNSTDQLPPQHAVADHSSNSAVIQRPSNRRGEVAMNSPARRPLSKIEREQLAADLRLVAANNDSELDLLDDRINQ